MNWHWTDVFYFIGAILAARAAIDCGRKERKLRRQIKAEDQQIRFLLTQGSLSKLDPFAPPPPPNSRVKR